MGFLSFIGDALNDILGGNSSRRDSQRYNLQNMEIQQGYNLQNMQLQNQYNIEAFQRENDYNSPLAQQERLRRAGLNVNWSDSGSAIAQQDSGVSSSTPSGSMPSGQNAGGLGDLISIGSAIKDLKVKQSEIDLNKALEKKAKSDSFKADEEGKGQSFQNWLAENYGVPEKEAGISLTSESAALTSKQKENYFSESVARIGKLLAERENIDLSNDQLKIVLKYLSQDIVSRINLQNAQIPYFGSMTNLNNVNAAYVPTFANAAQTSANAAVLQGKAAVMNASTNRFLSSHQAASMDASTYSQNLLNNIEYDLYKDGVQESQRRYELGKISQELDLLRQKYRTSKARETFGVWLNRELNEGLIPEAVFIRRFLQSGDVLP